MAIVINVNMNYNIFKIQIPPERAKMPIEAFGIAPFLGVKEEE